MPLAYKPTLRLVGIRYRCVRRWGQKIMSHHSHGRVPVENSQINRFSSDSGNFCLAKWKIARFGSIDSGIGQMRCKNVLLYPARRRIQGALRCFSLHPVSFRLQSAFELTGPGCCIPRATNPQRDITMANGAVKWFNAAKGFGFIAPEHGGKDVFLHISALERAGLNRVADGQAVTFEIESGRDGRESASRLALA